jgi:hypothetical protein
MGKEVLNLCNASVHYEVTEDILNTFVNDLTNKVTKKIVSLQNAEKAQHNLSVNEVCELLNVSKGYFVAVEQSRLPETYNGRWQTLLQAVRS